MTVFLPILFFSLTWWLGLYLLQRHSTDPRLFWTGAGLATYALGIADLLVFARASPSSTPTLPLQLWWLLSLPALFWTGAALFLLPETHVIRPHLMRFWQYGQLPLVALLAPLFFAADPDSAMSRWLQSLLTVAVLLPLGSVLILLVWSTYSTTPRRLSPLLLVAALLFGLSVVALLLPILSMPVFWIILIMGFDLMLLGFAIAKLDAFEQGENFLPDLLLALSSACLPTSIFGGLVSITMITATGVTTPMLVLLLTIISAAIALQHFAPVIQARLDRLILAPTPALIEERAELRALADALPRHLPSPPISQPLLREQASDNFTEADLVRLTRRALSQMNDLNKLTTNPLTNLPLVEQRLLARRANDNTLERAQELRTLLVEAINKLKPTAETTFNAGSAWRHYNALYYPYVVGLKPYSRRAIYDEVEPTAHQALTWFRSQVPERTLYNWQTAAAVLVAQSIHGATGQILDTSDKSPASPIPQE